MCGKVHQQHTGTQGRGSGRSEGTADHTSCWLETFCVLLCAACSCPSCQALIEKVPAASGPAACTCKASSSRVSSSCRCAHKQQHRLRCSACSKDFCDACWSIPYHEGLNCQEAAAPHCVLCDTLVLAAMDLQVSSRFASLQPVACAAHMLRPLRHSPYCDVASLCLSRAGPLTCCCCRMSVLLQTSGLSTKQLRAEASALGMDCSWCLERSELLAAYKRAKHVRQKLHRPCCPPIPVFVDCCMIADCCMLAAGVDHSGCCLFFLAPWTPGLGGAAGVSIRAFYRPLPLAVSHNRPAAARGRVQACDDCRPRLRQMCSRQLPCHHWCCGVRGSRRCLPCLQAGCEQQVWWRLSVWGVRAGDWQQPMGLACHGGIACHAVIEAVLGYVFMCCRLLQLVTATAASAGSLSCLQPSCSWRV